MLWQTRPHKRIGDHDGLVAGFDLLDELEEWFGHMYGTTYQLDTDPVVHQHRRLHSGHHHQGLLRILLVPERRVVHMRHMPCTCQDRCLRFLECRFGVSEYR